MRERKRTFPDKVRPYDPRDDHDEAQPEQYRHTDALLQRHPQTHDERHRDQCHYEISHEVDESSGQRHCAFVEAVTFCDWRVLPVIWDWSAVN